MKIIYPLLSVERGALLFKRGHNIFLLVSSFICLFIVMYQDFLVSFKFGLTTFLFFKSHKIYVWSRDKVSKLKDSIGNCQEQFPIAISYIYQNKKCDSN